MKRLVLFSMLLMFLVACTATQPVQNTTPVSNTTKPVSNVSVVEPKETYVRINNTITTLYNDGKQKFKWGNYVIELLYVSSDGSGCQLSIDGKSNWYSKDEDTRVDELLVIRVLTGYPTHGFTGDVCQIALIPYANN